MLKVAVLVSGGGSNLQAIIDAKQAGKNPNCDLCAVISSTDGAYALERAKKANIPTYVVPKKEYKGREEYTDAIIAKLQEVGAELIVLAGFMYILSPKFCEIYRNRVLNVHPSLIPSFCGDGFYGLHVHEAALSYGVKLSGATVHFVSEICDGGPIIMQKSAPVLEGDTPEILQKRIMEQCEWIILPEALRLCCDGKVEVVDGKVIIKEDV